MAIRRAPLGPISSSPAPPPFIGHWMETTVKAFLEYTLRLTLAWRMNRLTAGLRYPLRKMRNLVVSPSLRSRKVSILFRGTSFVKLLTVIRRGFASRNRIPNNGRFGGRNANGNFRVNICFAGYHAQRVSGQAEVETEFPENVKYWRARQAKLGRSDDRFTQRLVPYDTAVWVEENVRGQGRNLGGAPPPPGIRG